MDTALTRAFERVLRHRGSDTLLDGALVIARIGGRNVDEDFVRRELDLIAHSAHATAGDVTDPDAMAHAIDHELFVAAGFQGNASDYHDPENSFIDAVLRRRSGIPITLSLVYMEVSRRTGLPCDGVGYPGHFIVRCGSPDQPVYVDPFHGGVRLDSEELLAGLRGHDLRGVTPESYLAAVTPRQILQRMLYNLYSVYRQRGDLAHLHSVVSLLLCIEPWNAEFVGERGLLRYRLGEHEGAEQDLTWYIENTETERVVSVARAALSNLRLRRRERDTADEH